MLLVHCARRAASRADCTAGSNRAIKTPMIAMTTSSSIRVNPPRARRFLTSHPAFPDGTKEAADRERKGRSVPQKPDRSESALLPLEERGEPATQTRGAEPP